ncbi:MAG: hypothetical protein FE835_19215, partial [Gammaproteobacteria bacterium]|nr:hypothetical protein [Gammaproteobacteria bacterium]
ASYHLNQPFLLLYQYVNPKVSAIRVYPLMVASGQDGTHDEFRVKGPGVVTGRSGKIGVVSFVHQDFWPLNTTLWIKEYKSSSPYHAYYLLKSLGLERYNAGSAVPTLNRNHVHNVSQLIPYMTTIDAYGDFIATLYKRKHHNSVEVDQLAKLRDTLLPKLLSGQLRIPDAEKLVAEASA